MIQDDPEILLRILWTDEATFRSDGSVNRHNMHYWSPANPHWLQQVQNQGRWSLNVWCGIIGGRIIGPWIFNGRLNGLSYLNFLQNDLPILLRDIPLETRRNMWFQHDGCPAHFTARVCEFLNETYPGRWIGRGSLFPWPPRSPDLSCLDFYYWARIKDLVYITRPTTREDMIQRITDAARSLSVAEIETSVLATGQRIQSCIEQDGQHFEHLGPH